MIDLNHLGYFGILFPLRKCKDHPYAYWFLKWYTSHRADDFFLYRTPDNDGIGPSCIGPMLLL